MQFATAITMDSFQFSQRLSPRFFGSMLFSRHCTGARVVEPASSIKTISGREFHGYGSHCNAYPHPYLACACAIGMTKADVDTFLQRMQKCVREFKAAVRAEERRKGSPTDPSGCEMSGAHEL